MPLDLTILGAKDLKKVPPRFFKMRPFVVARVDHHPAQSTFVDKNGGVNPSWNERLCLQASDPWAVPGPLPSYLDITIYNKGPGFLGKTFVGAVKIPVFDLLYQSRSQERVTYQLWRRSGKPKGWVQISAGMQGETVAGPNGYQGYPQQVQYQQHQQHGRPGRRGGILGGFRLIRDVGMRLFGGCIVGDAFDQNGGGGFDNGGFNIGDGFFAGL